MTILGAILFASVILTSCGSSIDSDAKKVADIECKSQKLMQKASSGDMSVISESTKLAAEAANLTKELEGKYSSSADKEKFEIALLKAMGDCK